MTNTGMNRRDFLTMTGMGAVGAAFAKTPGEAAGPAEAGTFDVCVAGGSCTGVFAALRAAKALREGLTADRAYAGCPGGAVLV